MLEVLSASMENSRERGLREKILTAGSEIPGLIPGNLGERWAAPGGCESRWSSLQAPAAVYALHTLFSWTLTDLGVHALFSPFSYGILGAGIVAGLWAVSTRRVLGPRRNQAALAVLILLFWLGLPVASRVSEDRYRAGLLDNPVAFASRFGAFTMNGSTAAASRGPGWQASEEIALGDGRSFTLVSRQEPGAPPLRLLTVALMMGASFVWRRRSVRPVTR